MFYTGDSLEVLFIIVIDVVVNTTTTLNRPFVEVHPKTYPQKYAFLASHPVHAFVGTLVHSDSEFRLVAVRQIRE